MRNAPSIVANTILFHFANGYFNLFSINNFMFQKANKKAKISFLAFKEQDLGMQMIN